MASFAFVRRHRWATQAALTNGKMNELEYRGGCSTVKGPVIIKPFSEAFRLVIDLAGATLTCNDDNTFQAYVSLFICRRLKQKMNKIEANQNEKQPKWKMTKLEDNQN